MDFMYTAKASDKALCHPNTMHIIFTCTNALLPDRQVCRSYTYYAMEYVDLASCMGTCFLIL